MPQTPPTPPPKTDGPPPSNKADPSGSAPASTETTPVTRPSVHLNWQDWLPYLEDSPASAVEKRQLIETLWSIILAFVDLGWEIAPDQEIGGQALDLTALLRDAVVYSKQNQVTESEEV